jgi:hypothetical protein
MMKARQRLLRFRGTERVANSVRQSLPFRRHLPVDGAEVLILRQRHHAQTMLGVTTTHVRGPASRRCRAL